MQSLRFNVLILALFFLLTFPAYFALLHPGMLTSHDGEGHIIRMFEFNNALDDGHFPVRWSKRLNWGLGYPFFNFNYPLPYYLSFVLFKLGLDLLTIFKLFLAVSIPFSGFFAYLWLKNHFSKIPAFIGGLFYTLIPYHFVNIYVRGNIAETFALTLVPLNFYLVNRLKQKPATNNVIWLSICLSAVILSHNLSAMLFLPIILIYGLLLNFSKNYLKYLILAFVLPLFITAFFWIPALFDKQFITIDQKFPLYYAKQFPNFLDLIYSPWGYGGSNVGAGQMSVQIGLLHLVIFALSLGTVIFTFKKTKQRKIPVFFFILSALAFFMMLGASKTVWDLVKPIQYLQFPWRLLAILSLTSSFLGAFLISSISKILPKKVMFFIPLFLIIGLFFLNRNHWRANKYYDLPNYWFLDGPYGSTTTVDGEHTPKWQLEDSPNETKRYEVVSGEAKIESLAWKTNYHLFQADAKSKSVILDRTVYFPGWTVFIDGQKAKTIDQNDPKTKGLIGFELPEGKHKVEVRLLESPVHKFADIVSLASLVILLAVAVKLIVIR